MILPNSSGEPASDSAPAESTDLLPARMLNEFTYCPRLFYLEHVEGLFANNADTTEGTFRHRRVDKKGDALPVPEKDELSEKCHARSITLSCASLGIIAKMDLVESEGLRVTPVDYKKGSPLKLEDGSLSAWDPERVQICVQALVLRANGFECNEGVLFFWETRQRVVIPIDEPLIAMTKAMIQQARQTMVSQRMPLPLVDSPKCPRCSLVGICLPDEINRCVETGPSIADKDSQLYLFDIGPQFTFRPNGERKLELRRQLITARDERKPLYLNTQGYTVGISGHVLKIKDKQKLVQEARLNEISQVNLFGLIQVSTQAIQALLGEDIPLIYFSLGGWFHGMTQPIGLKNIFWRREQFRKADRRDFCLSFAKSLVVGKIKNCRTLLMRNHIEPPASTLSFLKSIEREAGRAEDQQELLGLEGVAARSYFEVFSGMLKASESSDLESAGDSSPFNFHFEHRNRRPPKDPVNALLSLGYSLLSKDLTIAAASAGLDPYMGFYHQPRFGRPALALDMMEPFRPLIVDSAVLSAVNQRMVTKEDFIQVGDSVALTPNGRKGFFRAYEGRMDQLVTHPMFGYRVSYRRLLEIQVRLFARVLLGELDDFPVFVTR